MTLPGCIPPTALRDLLLGLLSEVATDELGGHLADCRHCTRAAAAVSAEDDLTAAARTAEQFAHPTAHDLITRLIELGGAGSCPAAEPADWRAHICPPEGPDEVGRLAGFRLLRVLGRGGMGIVFAADDPGLRRTVALKILPPSLCSQPAARERFRREAWATAGLRHENVVSIYQVGEAVTRDGLLIPFFTMPLLHGESLGERLARGPMPVAEAVEVACQVAAGLAAAHTTGLIHRDIQPANLWLETQAEPNPARVVILDFGLVQVAEDERLTRPGGVLGTPRYMAPEQAEGGTVDARSDLFSLGCVLYHMLAGAAPFDRVGVMQTLRALALERPVPVTRLRPGVPLALAGLVARLLSKRPADRPATATETARLLGAAIGPAPARRRLGFRAVVAAVLLVGGVAAVALNRPAKDIRTGTPPVPPDAESAEVSFPTPETGGHHGTISRALFRPPDGRELITIAEDKTVRIWYAHTGAALRTLRPPVGSGPVGSLTAATISPDGATLAVAAIGRAGGEYPVYLIDLASDQLVRTLAGPPGRVSALAFSPKGDRLAGGGPRDGSVLFWDVASGERVTVLPGGTGAIADVAYSPSGDRIAAACSDGMLYVWPLADPRKVAALTGHLHEVNCVAWSPDGATVVSGGRNDPVVRVWDLKTRRTTAEITLPLDKGVVLDVRAVQFHPDGRRVFCGWSRVEDIRTRDGVREVFHTRAAGLYDFKTGQPDGELLTRANYTDTKVRAALARDGNRAVLTGGTDHEFHLWEPRDPASAVECRGVGCTPLTLSWGTDATGPVLAWDFADPRSGRLPEPRPRANLFHLSRLERLRAPAGVTFPPPPTSGQGLTIDIPNEQPTTALVRDSKRVVATLGPVTPTLRCFALLPSERAVLGGSGLLRLYDVRKGKPADLVLTGYSSDPKAVAPSCDGRFLAAAFTDQTIRVWDLRPPGGRVAPVLSLVTVGDEWVAWTDAGPVAASPHGVALLGRAGGSSDPLTRWQPTSLPPTPGHSRDAIVALFASP